MTPPGRGQGKAADAAADAAWDGRGAFRAQLRLTDACAGAVLHPHFVRGQFCIRTLCGVSCASVTSDSGAQVAPPGGEVRKWPRLAGEVRKWPRLGERRMRMADAAPADGAAADADAAAAAAPAAARAAVSRQRVSQRRSDRVTKGSTK